MSIVAYIRISTEKQTVENQRFEILKFADSKRLQIDQWFEEIVSGTKSFKERSLGQVLENLKKNDVLIVSELSRLGRNLMEVMSILQSCMEKDCKVFAIKEGYELGNNISSKVLAFAFSLSAEIERNLISQRTKEALARKKSEGMTLGRPKGSFAKETKLTGKEVDIKNLLDKKVSVCAVARIYGVNRLTIEAFVQKNNLRNFV